MFTFLQLVGYMPHVFGVELPGEYATLWDSFRSMATLIDEGQARQYIAPLVCNAVAAATRLQSTRQIRLAAHFCHISLSCRRFTLA